MKSGAKPDDLPNFEPQSAADTFLAASEWDEEALDTIISPTSLQVSEDDDSAILTDSVLQISDNELDFNLVDDASDAVNDDLSNLFGGDDVATEANAPEVYEYQQQGSAGVDNDTANPLPVQNVEII